jgi:hypothetical protein
MRFNIRKLKSESLSLLNHDSTLEMFEKLSFNKENSAEFESTTEKINGNDYTLEIDIDNYIKIAKQEVYTKDANKQISYLLYKDLKKLTIPKFVFYESEFWSFLNMYVFKDLINYLYFEKNQKDTDIEDEDKKLSKLDKYKRYFFNLVPFSNISRTGIWFLWHVGNKIGESSSNDLYSVAFDFIDPVKAMIERNQGKNNKILICWLKVLLSLDEHYRVKIKSKKFKSAIPTHLNNLSVIFALESLDENNMIERMKKEVIEIINFLETSHEDNDLSLDEDK